VLDANMQSLPPPSLPSSLWLMDGSGGGNYKKGRKREGRKREEKREKRKKKRIRKTESERGTLTHFLTSLSTINQLI
jgi:hypothetical protein